LQVTQSAVFKGQQLYEQAQLRTHFISAYGWPVSCHSSEVPALLILTQKAGWLRVQIAAGILAIAIVKLLVVLHDSRQKDQTVPQIRQRPTGKDYGAFIKGYA
jgi:acid phosphatase family membrane protein YuiD